MTDCLIAGGGLAGLAAAAELCSRGHRILLLESRRNAGGRAYSFVDRESGTELDNGQHLLLGAYTATNKYLTLYGTGKGMLRIRRMRIPFLHTNGKRSELSTGRIPNPLGMIRAFLGYGALSYHERLSVFTVIRGTISLNRDPGSVPEHMDSLSWLSSLKQSRNTIEFLWRPVVLATMNTEPENASALLLARVLKEIFLSGRRAQELLLPEVGLSALLVRDTVDYIRTHGGTVKTGYTVRIVKMQDGNTHVVRSGNGEEFTTRSIIAALPPWPLGKLFDESGISQAAGVRLGEFEPSPIVSIHVWTGSPLTREPMTGLLGSRLQWIFYKGEENGVHRYSCTISAGRELVEEDDSIIHELVRGELRLMFSTVQEPLIRRIMVLRERNATFVPKPGIENHRPGTHSGIDGLFLAGDWTDTGLPATIESAVRSGFTAAGAVSTYLGRRQGE